MAATKRDERGARPWAPCLEGEARPPRCAETVWMRAARRVKRSCLERRSSRSAVSSTRSSNGVVCSWSSSVGSLIWLSSESCNTSVAALGPSVSRRHESRRTQPVNGGNRNRK